MTANVLTPNRKADVLLRLVREENDPDLLMTMVTGGPARPKPTSAVRVSLPASMAEAAPSAAKCFRTKARL